jgi:hypothetical protein
MSIRWCAKPNLGICHSVFNTESRIFNICHFDPVRYGEGKESRIKTTGLAFFGFSIKIVILFPSTGFSVLKI